MVTTNNGVEALNNSLKTHHLKLKGISTLTTAMEVLIQSFVLDQIMRYKQTNYIATSQYREYNSQVPEFLHNKPKAVVEHCL